MHGCALARSDCRQTNFRGIGPDCLGTVPSKGLLTELANDRRFVGCLSLWEGTPTNLAHRLGTQPNGSRSQPSDLDAFPGCFAVQSGPIWKSLLDFLGTVRRRD
jgi:hypothetical protein